jgi:hypothetical protein
MIAKPAIPSVVIAVSMALIAAVLAGPFRSLRSAPQRLQKLNSFARGVPQFGQNISLTSA